MHEHKLKRIITHRSRARKYYMRIAFLLCDLVTQTAMNAVGVGPCHAVLQCGECLELLGCTSRPSRPRRLPQPALHFRLTYRFVFLRTCRGQNADYVPVSVGRSFSLYCVTFLATSRSIPVPVPHTLERPGTARRVRPAVQYSAQPPFPPKGVKPYGTACFCLSRSLCTDCRTEGKSSLRRE